MKRATVLGAGGMGTALAALLAGAVDRVSLWARDPGCAQRIQTTRLNQRHLPDCPLPATVVVTADPAEACDGTDLLVVAVPTAYLRTTLTGLAGAVPAGVPALSVVKGIEFETFALPSRIISESLGPRSVAVLSGPSHAEEFARGLPTSVVVAGFDDGLNRAVQGALNRGRFRVYTNPDARGVELAGALKNILGVAAGICEGLGFGDNAKAALLTRGLVEIRRLGVALGAQGTTFYGLAGLGDVMTTCFSPFGRNRAVGVRIGRGERLAEIQASTTSVAEGVFTTRSVHHLAARQGVEMPITDEVYRILFEDKPPLDALSDLMLRPPREEAP